ncbi:hypothetical protein [Natrarchaeobius oligotrophus]|uniref:Uncharacterized protein n=1 Tax=Natrarchaeobius chitinivorans TaxID=1679083 RepID=A0A3N6MDR9_NATCH|nr:hypothetical protein [Natrarchaeobius chitinivorans]RQG93711.1 hypothetical protein EA472_22510 [Natrarchaeobius chitinivorans]
MFWRTRYHLARLVAYAICEPKLRLGKRRHDNHCDRCGDHCGRYAAHKLDFPLEDDEIEDPDATSKWEKLRAMWDAEYVRVCLECSVELESDSENSSGNGGGSR